MVVLECPVCEAFAVYMHLHCAVSIAHDLIIEIEYLLLRESASRSWLVVILPVDSEC